MIRGGMVRLAEFQCLLHQPAFFSVVVLLAISLFFSVGWVGVSVEDSC